MLHRSFRHNFYILELIRFLSDEVQVENKKDHLYRWVFNCFPKFVQVFEVAFDIRSSILGEKLQITGYDAEQAVLDFGAIFYGFFFECFNAEGCVAGNDYLFLKEEKKLVRRIDENFRNLFIDC